MRAFLIISFLALVTLLLPGCDFIGDIFRTGVGVGIFIAVVVLALVLLIGRIGRRRS